jgi:hypothetical protein
MKSILGIDFGSHSVKISLWKDGQVDQLPLFGGSYTISSMIGFIDENEIIIGPDANNFSRINPKRCVNPMRNLVLNKEESILLNQQRFSYKELFSKFFIKLKKEIENSLDEKVLYVILTSHVSFTNTQLYTIHTSAEKAGFYVLGTVIEPIAAYFYCLSEGFINKEQHKFLVFDLGETFNISILQSNSPVSVIGYSGDKFIGGGNFTWKVFDYLSEKIFNKTGIDVQKEENNQIKHDLFIHSENAKCLLSSQESTNVILTGLGIEEQITREELNRLILPEIEKTFSMADKTLDNLGLTKNDIDSILLIGGSSQIPIVRKIIEEQGFPSNEYIDPRFAICNGAALYGATLYQKKVMDQENILYAKPSINQVNHNLCLKMENEEEYILLPKGTELPNNTNFHLRSVEDSNTLFIPLVESDKTYYACHNVQIDLPWRLNKLEEIVLGIRMNKPEELELDIYFPSQRQNFVHPVNLNINPVDKSDDKKQLVKKKDQVDCTVFSPPEIKCGGSVMIQVFTHLFDKSKEAEVMANEFDEEAVRRGFTSLSTEIEMDSKLTFELSFPDIKVDEPVQSLIWKRRTESVEFVLNIPDDYSKENLIGKVCISQNTIPIGNIRFKIKVISEQKSYKENNNSIPHGYAKQFKNAFISYASEDRSEVLRRVQMLSTLKINYFQDILNLEPGDRWEKEIYKQIDKADVFFLFWSNAAQKSKWVSKEIKYALNCKKGNDLFPPEILPILLNRSPIPEPPEELKHIHFNDKIIYFMEN